MRTLPLIMLIVLTLLVSGCAALGAVFKAGVASALIGLLLLLGLIYLLLQLIR